VARLAGLPTEVLKRAEEILQGLEERETDASGKPARIKPREGKGRRAKDVGMPDLFG
jgi:DNA mismatch repair ATPase MutS